MRSLVRLGEFDRAVSIGTKVVATLDTSEAHGLLGYAAQRADQFPLAKESWHKAFALTLPTGDSPKLAGAVHGLLLAYLSTGELAAASAYWQLVRFLYILVGDESNMQFAELNYAEIQMERGALGDAERGAKEVVKRIYARTPVREYNLMWARLRVGILQVASDVRLDARRELHDALVLATALNARDVSLSVHLNLAWIERKDAEALRDAGSPDAELHFQKSLDHLEQAKVFGADEFDLHLLRGLVMYERGLLEEASSEFELAYRAPRGARIPWALNYYRGRVAESQGDRQAALAAYEESSNDVKAWIENAKGGGHAGVAASQRPPFQRRLGLYAAEENWTKVLEVLVELDELSMITAEYAPISGQPNEKSRQNPITPGTPLSSSGQLSAEKKVALLLSRWRDRRLIVLVSDEKKMWRLEVQGGRVQSGRSLGDAKQIEALAERLRDSPDDWFIASLLGGKILPSANSLSTAEQVVEILAIGRVAGLPLAALRRGRRLAIEDTLLARVISLHGQPRSDEPHSGVVVIGDAEGDLPTARVEATSVAVRGGGKLFLGPDVDLNSFRMARRAALLYVATHSEITELGPSIPFSGKNGSLGVENITGLDPADRISPDVVVLSSCGSAAARDESGWGSLAGAFLDAGSRAVVASSEAVADKPTSELAKHLNLEVVQRNPARALRDAQLMAHKDGMNIEEWSAFTVLLAPP